MAIFCYYKIKKYADFHVWHPAMKLLWMQININVIFDYHTSCSKIENVRQRVVFQKKMMMVIPEMMISICKVEQRVELKLFWHKLVLWKIEHFKGNFINTAFCRSTYRNFPETIGLSSGSTTRAHWYNSERFYGRKF